MDSAFIAALNLFDGAGFRFRGHFAESTCGLLGLMDAETSSA